MKKILILLVLATVGLQAQSIRKNYREMTTWEKSVFTNAIKALIADTRSMDFRTSNNLPVTGAHKQDQFGNVHAMYFNSSGGVHNEERFTSWHRWFDYVYEKELKMTTAIGSNLIALPYWDWTSRHYTTAPLDNQTTAPLWDFDFMGQFNSLLSLGRNPGGTLPDVASVVETLSWTDYTSFRPSLEYNNHNTVHTWVKGIMGGGRSPLDPIFFLHHNMVDKIWQNWTDKGNDSPFPANRQILNGLNTSNTSNDMKDSRNIKVWFAENSVVGINKYTASGTENYDYTGNILFGASTSILSGFTVPSGVVVNATSATQIAFLPGTALAPGSYVSAKIDASKFNGQQLQARQESSEIVLNQQPLISGIENIEVFPNPFENEVNVKHNFKGTITLKIIDVLGKIVYQNTHEALNAELFTIETQDLSKGFYTLVLNANSKFRTFKIIK